MSQAYSAASMLDGLSGLITPDLISRTGVTFGESEQTVAKGFGAALPAILAALASKAGDSSVMSQVFNLVRDPANDSRALSDPAALLRTSPSASPVSDLGSRLLATLFGSDTYPVASALSNSTGVKTSTASSILTAAAPLVLGYLGNLVRRDGLSMASFSSMFQGLRASIADLMPASLRSAVVPAMAGGSVAAGAAERAAAGTPWRWIIALALIVLALWGLYRWSSGGQTEAPATAGSADLSNSLPGGVVIRYPATGVEARLLEFITNPGMTVDRETWFDFDRLLFDPGKATLRRESRPQLSNIAAILRAYPAVNVKIGGYTDNTGDPAVNLQLSGDRAAAVRAELISMGIAPDRLASEGYGDQHPVADNTTDAGRAQNRRVSIRVTAK